MTGLVQARKSLASAEATNASVPTEMRSFVATCEEQLAGNRHLRQVAQQFLVNPPTAIELRTWLEQAHLRLSSPALPSNPTTEAELQLLSGHSPRTAASMMGPLPVSARRAAPQPRTNPSCSEFLGMARLVKQRLPPISPQVQSLLMICDGSPYSPEQQAVMQYTALMDAELEAELPMLLPLFGIT